MKSLQAVKATVIDDNAFRLLAFPFGGPIPSPHSAKGVDLDGEFFSERTDVKADWFPFRIVDWHHGTDPRMGRTVLGKAELDPEPDDDGRWVTVWLKHGERRVDLIRKLADKGAQLFGSSESMPGLTQKAKTGEILVWPYMRQTLSTSPQNTLSVLRPMKATLDDLAMEGAEPAKAFFTDLYGYLDDLATRPFDDPTGDSDAKAGRVLAARNEARLREGIAALESSGWHPVRRKEAIAEITAVLDELERYVA